MGVREMRRSDSTCSLSSFGRRVQEGNVEVEISDTVGVEGMVVSAILRVDGESFPGVVLASESAMWNREQRTIYGIDILSERRDIFHQGR